MTLPLSLVLVLATAAPGKAQTSLTLDRAVTEALAHNPGLAQARAAEERSTAGLDEARAAWFPRVSFSESWQRGDEPVFVFGGLLASRHFTEANFAIPALNSPASLNVYRTTLGVGQTLFDAGRVSAAVTAAREHRAMASASLRQAESDLALSVVRAFAAVLRAQAAGRTAHEAVTAAEADVARAGHRRDAGTATEADVLSAQVHLADMQQREIQATGDAAIAIATLNRLMGAPIGSTIVVEAPAPVPAPGAPADPAALFAEADAARPDLARAAAAERAAAAVVRQTRAGWWPQVSAEAGVNLTGLDFADRAGSWIVGANLSWNLSTGGAERARVRAAVAEASAARAAADDARAAAEVEVISALRRLEAARARGGVAQTAVAHARESLRIIRDRYDAGLAAINDVLAASTSLADAEARQIDAVVDAVISQAELDHALGRRPSSSR